MGSNSDKADLIETLPVELPTNSWFKTAAVAVSKQPLPGEERTFCEVWDDLTRDIGWFGTKILKAKTLAEIDAFKARIEFLNDQKALLRKNLWVGIQQHLAEGNLWALAQLRGRKVVVPCRAWANGDYDWDARVLLDGETRYNGVLAIVGPLAADQQEFVLQAVRAVEIRQVVTETGAPGRPSSKHLVIAEFRSRCDAGTVAPTLAEESRQLEQWLDATHGEDVPPMTAKSIENAIRPLYRAFKLAGSAP